MGHPHLPGRRQALRRLRSPFVRLYLPLTVGELHPDAVIAREPDGRYTLRPLVLDQARAAAAGAAALAAGRPWMPEMELAFLHPGEPLASAASGRGLARALERLGWAG